MFTPAESQHIQLGGHRQTEPVSSNSIENCATYLSSLSRENSNVVGSQLPWCKQAARQVPRSCKMLQHHPSGIDPCQPLTSQKASPFHCVDEASVAMTDCPNYRMVNQNGCSTLA
jgi:hypothetical protein